MTAPLVKGGIVLVDPASGALRRVVALQYNPDQLSRSFQAQSFGDGDGPAGALRLKGPALETFRLEADLDATDQPAAGDPAAAQLGLHPAIAALELLVQPAAADLDAQARLAGMGMLEIAPLEQPLALFAFGASRVAPVRMTELSVTEEAFDAALNPIRAKATLSLRVLSVTDLGFRHRGGVAFMAMLRAREALSRRAPAPHVAALGLGGLP
jgi:hypothetical protein